MAMSEPRPGRIVLRASKVLATSGWCGEDYLCRFTNPIEVDDFLRAAPVGIVIVDLSTRDHVWQRHHELLLEACTDDPVTWRELPPRSVVRNGQRFTDALRIFVQEGHRARPHAPIDVDAVIGTRVLPFGLIAKPGGG